MLECGDAKRLPDIAEGILRHNSFLRLAQDESNARPVVGMAEHVIDSGEVEVHLACVLRLERSHLQIDHHEASELQMVEEEIELEILASNFQRNLAPDEGEAHAELDQELAKMRKQSVLEIALLRLLRQSKEVEVVGIFENLLSEIGLRRRQCRPKIGDGFPLSPVKAAFDLHHKDVPAPAVLD